MDKHAVAGLDAIGRCGTCQGNKLRGGVDGLHGDGGIGPVVKPVASGKQVGLDLPGLQVGVWQGKGVAFFTVRSGGHLHKAVIGPAGQGKGLVAVAKG